MDHDHDWDCAVLTEQARTMMQQRLAGKRSASALGLGRGRSRRRTIITDTRSAAPAEAAASSVVLAAVARGARGRRLAHEKACAGQATRGASAQLAPTEATRLGVIDEAGTAQAKAKAKKANKATGKMAKANKVKANRAEADKAKANNVKSNKANADSAKANKAKANKATANSATAKATATAHCSDDRVAPAALLTFPSAGLRGVPQVRVGAECSGMEPVAMALRNLGVLDQCSLDFCCEINKWCSNFILQNHPPKHFFGHHAPWPHDNTAL